MLGEPSLLNQSQMSSRGTQVTATPQQLPLAQAFPLIATPTLLSLLPSEYPFSVSPRAITIACYYS